MNVVGTLNVLEAARPPDAQVVFSSTGGAIYGECERPAREDDERRPLSPYGTAKLAAEEYLAMEPAPRDASRGAPLRERLRAAAVAKLEGGVVAIFTDRLRAGEGVTIYGDGSRPATTSTSATSSPRCSRRSGETAASSTSAPGRDVRERALRDVPAGGRRRAGGDPRACARRRRGRSVLDVSRAERELGWRPRTSLADGLRQTWG